MSDLIDRQAAIDALDTAAEHWNIAEPYHEGMRTGFRNAARIVLSLPSAQPEIIRCKDCEFWQDNNGGYPNMNCRWIDDETPDAEDYCSYAKRKGEQP